VRRNDHAVRFAGLNSGFCTAGCTAQMLLIAFLQNPAPLTLAGLNAIDLNRFYFLRRITSFGLN
jgi:hypothetical protein